MSVRYVFVDQDSNEYRVTDKTFRRLDDNSKIEVDDIERSFRAGSDFPGIQRDESKEISYTYDPFDPTVLDYRIQENYFRYWLRKTRIIKDIKDQIQTEVFMTDHSIGYLDGTFKHVSQNEVTFKQLRPYWEDIEYQVEYISGSENIVVIDNTASPSDVIRGGYIETPFIITIEAQEGIPKFSVILNETREGIVINDLQFGLNGLNTYQIDMFDGESELNGIDRRDKIRSGTGFFNLRVGINTLIINASGIVDITVRWKRRYYL